MLKLLRQNILVFCLTFFSANAVSQIISPLSARYEISAKGGIEFGSNTILRCDGTGIGGPNCTDLTTQTPPTFEAWSQNNDHVSEYIDIDSDPTTFSSSADSLNLLACSEIVFAGIYWGGRSDDGDVGYPNRGTIKVGVNGGAYQEIIADEILDAGVAEGLGNRVYYCFADITEFVQSHPLESFYTVANIYSRLGGGSNRWGGWNIAVVYKNDTFPMQKLSVFDGLVNVNDLGTDVEINVSGFLTPPVGPVNFEIGVYGYDGDRGFVGDSLLFDGGSGFVAIHDALNPADDIFNSSQSINGTISTSQSPLIENNISIDADIFVPDNSTLSYIGNSATTATIKVTTSDETVQVQMISFAIDVHEPDLRSTMRVEDINGGLVEPGDTLEYSVVGFNIGSDPSFDSYFTDTLPENCIYVPNSIEVLFGPNLGPKTDLAGDDQAEFILADNVLRLNIGSGASASLGGEVTNSPTGIDSTLFKFRVTATEDCAYLSCDNVINNQTYIFGTGGVSGTNFNRASYPGITDLDGCYLSGSTDITVNNAGCPTLSDTNVVAYCEATVFADFPYDEMGYAYFDNTYAPVITADGADLYYAIKEIIPTCYDTIEIVVLDFVENPTASNAGIDQTVCIDPGTAILAGNNPAVGSGLWTVVAGGGTVTSPTLFNAEVTGLTAGTNTFAWTISNAPCPAVSSDEITIIVNELPSVANAGVDIEICGVDVVTLDANDPLIGEGEWTVTAGGGILTDPNNFDSDVTDLTPGENHLIWTITSEGCSPNFDEIIITVNPDTDGDGVCDDADTDTDGDGIPDEVEGTADTDGDGIPNNLDLDSDNDGIPDVTEAVGEDSNGDGRIDDLTDTDGDGLPDLVDLDDGGTALAFPDSDGDGISDNLDLDSDNDGLPDVIEAGGEDADGDGVLDDLTDVDGDGLSDLVDPDEGGTPLENPDSDNDGFPNNLDLDSDNDGIPDVIEAGGEDTDGDGVLDGFADVDGDGFSDLVDTDDNTVIGDGDGGISLDNPDFDFDSITDVIDLDSDNDGIVDVIEAGGLDLNGDGVLDGFADVDRDGFSDVVDTDDNTVLGLGDGGTALPIPNTDGTAEPDYLDIDADDDGISDNIEAQSTFDYVAPSANDINNNGIDDSYDISEGGSIIIPYDTDLDDLPDYQDLDSDNDGEQDLLEGWDNDGDGTADLLPSSDDNDGDGLDDAFDVVNLNAINTWANAENGTVNPLTDGVLADADFPTIGDLDFRESKEDADNDGVPDLLDADDDNDGIIDRVEDKNEDGDNDPMTNPTDTDGDGIIDIFDLDSDNDGIPDILEAEGMDENEDGRVDNITEEGVLLNDTDNDGLADIYDEDNGGSSLPNPDTDEDGTFDFQDLDSDNDGIFDVVEANGDDINHDGILDGIIDTNGDGWTDIGGLIPVDTDGDGMNDYKDADSDNDAVPDAIENDADGDNNGPDDTDNDGVKDYRDVDDDNDGILTLIESEQDGNGNYLDCNKNGIPDYLDAAPCNFFIPEGFSPDGDGINDFFVIIGIEAYPNASVIVFNRWGSKVYESINGYFNDWDGTNQFGLSTGQRNLPVGTYYYVIDLGEESNNTIKGSVFINK